MKRRQFLATTTALSTAALAGCGHPPVVLDMDDATPRDIADELSTTVDRNDDEHAAMETGVENGSATLEEPVDLFERDEALRFEDAFYNVSGPQLNTIERTVYTVHVEFDPDETTADRGEIRFADLPDEDRERLAPMLPDTTSTPSTTNRTETTATTETAATTGTPSTTGTTDGADSRSVEYGTADEVGDGSVFVPDQEYDIIVHGGDRYRVSVESTTTRENRYRYDVTEVAASVDAFAADAREQYLDELTGLTDAEREVVETAIDSGYFDDDEAFRSVVEKIRGHHALSVHDFYGTWLLEYEATAYLTYVEW